MKESEFRKKVKPILEMEGLIPMDVETVRDDGFPDLFCASKTDYPSIWVELKVVNSLKEVIRFRRSQRRWHRKIAKTTVISYIHVLNNETRVVYVFESRVFDQLWHQRLDHILSDTLYKSYFLDKY